MLKSNYLYSFTEMFLERVDGDHTRAIAFNKIVNKKCNNLRRQQL